MENAVGVAVPHGEAPACTHLPDEDVSSRNDRFSGGRLHCDLQQPRQPRDDVLHHTDVVEAGDDGAEEDDDGQHLEGEQVLLVRRAEHELRALVGVAHERAHLVAQEAEDRQTAASAQYENSHQELQAEPPQHRAEIDL